MNSVQDSHLVKRALRMAYTLRGDVPDGLVFHADRGTQFTSEQLWQVCRELSIAQSVGRTGVCFDNAMSESFWSTLKTEFYDRKNGQYEMKHGRLWLAGLRLLQPAPPALSYRDDQPCRFRSAARCPP